MELVVEFKLDKPYISKEYSSVFYSFLKQVLEEEDNEKYTELFGSKEAKIKKFCFYTHLIEPEFKEDLVHLGSEYVELHLRDCDNLELYRFYNSFLYAKKKYKKFAMKLNQARITSVKIKTFKEVEDSTLFIKFLSPLVVKEFKEDTKKNMYYTYQDNQFFEKLKAVIQNTSESLGYSFDFNGFEIIPINPQKTVVPIYGIQIPVSIGSYILKGNKDLLQFLYTTKFHFSTI